MAKLTPVEAASKHRDRLVGALDDIRKGIDRVTVAPGAKAADKRSKWVAKLSLKDTQDKWERNTRAVTLEQWKKQARDVGVDRIPAGIEAAQPKMAAFYSKLFPYQESLQATIRAMPDITIADSIARASKWITEMSKFSAG